jgi:hypothetical protein
VGVFGLWWWTHATSSLQEGGGEPALWLWGGRESYQEGGALHEKGARCSLRSANAGSAVSVCDDLCRPWLCTVHHVMCALAAWQ